MTLTRDQEKKLLIGLLAALMVFIAYRMFTAETQKVAPLTYKPGAVATSPIRKGVVSPEVGADPLLVFIERRVEKYPGVSRDIFRMADLAPKPKPAPAPVTSDAPLPPPPPEKTPEEIAAEFSRAELSKFRFLGYLTEKDSTLFLSKDEELFLVKSGDAVLKNYRVKSAGKDFVVLFDTITKVEVRVELSGSAEPSPPPQPQRGR